MSVIELMQVWRREQATIDQAIARESGSASALQDNLIDALTQARSYMRLEGSSKEFHQRAMVRARILAKYVRRMV